MLFELVYTLATLQKHVPGFRHNDLNWRWVRNSSVRTIHVSSLLMVRGAPVMFPEFGVVYCLQSLIHNFGVYSNVLLSKTPAYISNTTATGDRPFREYIFGEVSQKVNAQNQFCFSQIVVFHHIHYVF